jgi:hypothetical protein
MVLGLMAFSATAAQAEVGAKWLILTSGGVLKTGSELPAEINTEAETTAILHSKIAGIAVLYECLGQGLTGNPKLGANGSISTFQIRFSGCITKLNGVTSKACEPKAGGTESGVLKTLSLDALVVLHELTGGVKDDIIKVLPVTGNVYLHFELGELCSIGENVLVIGSLALKDCENLALTHLVKHLVEVFGPLTKLFVISETPEHAATLLGSAWAFLAGADTGLKWSWDPI